MLHLAGKASIRRRPVNSALGHAELRMRPLPHIAPADASDAAAFIELRGQTKENAVAASRLAALGITAETWARDVRTGTLIGYTAKSPEQLLGYCFGDTQTGEVVVLALLPQAEGIGLGRELLERVVAALRSAGHQRLFLGCSSDPKVRSYGFYRHLGWQPTGAIDNNNDEVLELVFGPSGCTQSVA